MTLSVMVQHQPICHIEQPKPATNKSYGKGKNWDRERVATGTGIRKDGTLMKGSGCIPCIG